MKKLTLLLVALSVATVTNAQKAVPFKFKYRPNYTYNMATKTAMDMEMNMTGDSAVTEKFKSSGMKMPMLMKMNMEAGAAIKTGAMAESKKVPFSMSYTSLSSKASMNGVEMPIPANNGMVGLTVTGSIDPDGKMNVDTTSAAGATAQDALKSAVTKMINQMATQIKFPEKPLKVGEAFTQEVPMSMPAGGFNMDFMMKITYKLTEIKDNLAYFDTQSTFDMTMNTKLQGQAMTGKGNGGGPGKMVFSIATDYPQSVNSDINMNFDMDMGVMKMGMKIKGLSDIQYVVNAN